MADQPRYDPLESSSLFANGMDSRPFVEGTVARGKLHLGTHFETGMIDGQPATTLPMPLTEALLARGQQRFNIFCAPCHDRTGSGRGMVVLRGFPQPPSYHIERLRDAPVGHLFDVTTRGFGRMSSYKDQIPAADRWAIVAYIRALQLSQNAKLDDLDPAQRATLERSAEARP